MDSSPRLHALDNLRATMMWLGVVLHVGVNHLVGPSPLPWRDAATTKVADLLLAFIHAFRMPVFFIVAGFFAALLLQRRGPGGFLRHRFMRIALPLLLLGPPIVAAMIAAGLAYLHRIVRGTWGLDPSLVPPGFGGRLNMGHLWFLYLLWWFCAATAAWAAVQPRLPAVLQTLPGAAARVLRRLAAAPWGFIVLVLPLGWAGAGYLNGVVTPQGSLLPPWPEWLHNGLFFAFGQALWGGRETLLPLWQRRWSAYALAGLPFFVASGSLAMRHAPAAAVALAYTASTWLWSLALIGLFTRHAARRHAAGAYLADAAYWVYLVHLPVELALAAAMAPLPWGVGTKMLVNIGLTTALALGSYQLLVRHTAIGRLLNGPRQPSAAAGLPAPAA